MFVEVFCKLRMQRARTGWRLERDEPEKGRGKGRGTPDSPTNRLRQCLRCCWTLQSRAACCIATARGLLVGLDQSKEAGGLQGRLPG